MSVRYPTQFDRVRVRQPVGTRIHITYTGKLDKNGCVQLVESGKTDVYAAIQSHRDSCDINLILKQYAMGNTAALNRGNPQYGDFTAMPRTLAEALNAVNAAQAFFESLDVDERKKFDFNFEKFISSLSFDEQKPADPSAPETAEKEVSVE